MQFAQLNIARLTQPLEHPDTADFVAGLEPINALAEQSPGFVWRLQDDAGDATSIRAHPDPNVIVNLTVWETPQALHDFVFRSAHTPFLRRRAEWFTPMDGPHAVAWWIEAGHRPSVEEAFARLEFLAEHGASPYAFGVTRPAAQLSIRRTDLTDPAVVELIAELNDHLSALYPEPGSTHFRIDAAEVDGDSGAMVLARLDGDVVGCGAFRMLSESPQTAEIKRMYVRDSARGRKVGAAILADLEHRAGQLQARRVVLETGVHQHAAIACYTRAGYTTCECWGEYTGTPTSVCMHKSIAAT